MAPTLAGYARTALTHALFAREPDVVNPAQAHHVLTARDNSDRPDPEKGVLHPGDINNKAIFAVFGLLGVAIIAIGIWFFFWAKNGGFHFQENDWDDYKTTVLRRRGPNGTILSGATTITDLGGGSVYKDLHEDDDDNQTELTGITGGVSNGFARQKDRRHREKKERDKERDKERRREEKRREKDEKATKKSRAAKVAKSPKPKRKVGGDGAVIDDEAEAEAAAQLRNYRHERPARVGGLNRESDASTWDGSTNAPESSRGGYTESTVTSDLMPSKDRYTPPSSPEKKKAKGGGIRKVYSTADKRDSREAERIRAEARKLQEKGRAAAASSSGGRRNFSWQRDNVVDEGTAMMPPPTYSQSEVETRIPGSYVESDAGSDIGTRVYSHVIPGLSSSGGGSSVAGTDVRDYAEERRKNRRSGGGGYRRER